MRQECLSSLSQNEVPPESNAVPGKCQRCIQVEIGDAPFSSGHTAGARQHLTRSRCAHSLVLRVVDDQIIPRSAEMSSRESCALRLAKATARRPLSARRTPGVVSCTPAQRTDRAHRPIVQQRVFSSFRLLLPPALPVAVA